MKSPTHHIVVGGGSVSSGGASPHPKPDSKKKIGITKILDYCFMNGEDDEHPDLAGVLIVRHDSHGSLWAIPVDKKELVDLVVKLIIERMDT